MLLPNRLTSDSTLGIVAPASSEHRDIIHKKLCDFSELGFKTIVGSHVFDKLGHLAGSDRDRASDFNHLYSLPEIQGIISFRGGYGTIRMMPYLDYKSIYRRPKIICGYSDLTVLINFLAQRLGVIAFHGPMVNSDFKEENTRNSFLQCLMKGYEPYTIENPKGYELDSSCDVSTCGTLAGGNLSLICASLGTPYELDFTDKILFIEEVGERPYAIDRMLTTLILSGRLQRCRGIILGQFTDCDAQENSNSLSVEEVLAERLLPLKKPILSGLMCGHDHPKLTLPIGAKIQLDCKNKLINVLQPVVK